MSHSCTCPAAWNLRPIRCTPQLSACYRATYHGIGMTVLLSVQGLSKGFGLRPLFTDLSLDLRAGARVGLIGPNGSGKSTLLRLLAGREESDAGTRTLRR